MSTTTTITDDNLKKEVSIHLSLIGKRLKDKDASTLFGTITLSTAEESIIGQYTKSALAHISAEFPELITDYNEGTVSITVSRDRWNGNMSAAFSSSVNAALIACVTYEIISSYAPDYSKKFADDVNSSIKDLRAHLYTPLAPSAPSKSLGDCIGVVELNM